MVEKTKRPYNTIFSDTNTGRFEPGDWLVYDEDSHCLLWRRGLTRITIDGDDKFWWPNESNLSSLLRFISAFCGITFECWTGEDLGVGYERVFVVRKGGE